MPDSIVSLLGDTLVPPPLAEETRERLLAHLADAQGDLGERPDDPKALIWVGRRTAYLGDYREAAAIFSRGIERWPEDPRFYRHRGHRRISLRQFEEALADLREAARLIEGTADETEPDGQPNARGIPTSTLHFNVFYHLALAQVLRGEFEHGLAAQRAYLEVSKNPDAQVATIYWLVMNLRRLGRPDEAAALLAPITPDLDVIENGAYHRLLLLYKGELAPEELLNSPENSNAALHDATTGYGIGVWHLTSGRDAQAMEWFRRVYAGPQWAAFGYIAAEAELSRQAR